MTSNTGPIDEPNWDLLPHQAAEFFGVDRDCDARTLKRAYNRLIRKYKPEKFPVEFQKIRAAYESLSSDLRYGHSQASAINSSFDWSQAVSDDPLPPDIEFTSDRSSEVDRSPSPNSPSGSEARERTRILSIDQQLDAEPIMEVYQRLASKEYKSPRDYLNLALLVIAMRNDCLDSSFQDWLLEGVATYPQEAGLVSLLREYLKTSIPIEELGGFLRRAANCVTEDRYFYITEPGWDRLIRNVEFSSFRRTLTDTESQLDLGRDNSSLIFFLHLMRPAIVVADSDWLEEKTELFEDHFYSLPDWAQEEFEVVGRVMRYRRIRDQFRERGPVRQQIDSAIEQWCLAENGKADEAVLECQYFIAANGDQLLSEFPDHKETQVDLTVPWEYIVGDVQNRIGESYFKSEVAEDYVFDFMARVTRRNNRGSTYVLGLLGAMFGFALAVYTLVIAGAFLVKAVMTMVSTSVLSGFGWVGVAVGIAVVGIAVALWVFKKGRKYSSVQYPLIRGEVLKLLRVVPLDFRELLRLVLAMDRKAIDSDVDISDADVVVEGMIDDVAIVIYSIAQRCLNLAAE